MKVLVTGSSGFIARFLVPAVVGRGCDVIGVDKRAGPQFGGAFRFIQGNILDEAVVSAAMDKVDLILHLAAEHKDFGVDKDTYYRTNVDGTATLLREADRQGVNKFVFFSSVAVYGESSRPAHEDIPTDPVSPYGVTKLLAEEYIGRWRNEVGNRAVVTIRPTVVFGPWNYANMFRLIGSLSRRRYIGVGNGMNIKSVAYVENLAAATMYLIDRMQPGSQIYNYADTPHLTTRELVECIAQNLGVGIPSFRIPKALALACAFPLDIVAKVTGSDLPVTAKRLGKFTNPTIYVAEKIQKAGFVAPYTLEEGVRKTVNWYRGRGGRPEELESI